MKKIRVGNSSSRRKKVEFLFEPVLPLSIILYSEKVEERSKSLVLITTPHNKAGPPLRSRLSYAYNTNIEPQ